MSITTKQLTRGRDKIRTQSIMSNTFVNSVVRGAGFTIGRNLVGDFGKRQRPTQNRYYERAEDEVQKALNFPIQGRSETILGKCFNLYQELENDLTSSFICQDTTFNKSRIEYYKETIEKFEDCIEYLTIKNSEDETIQKIDTIMEKSTDIFTTYINKTVPTLLKQSIGYTKEVWVRLRPIYLQTNPNSELISKIDDYAKQPEIINIIINITTTVNTLENSDLSQCVTNRTNLIVKAASVGI